MGICSECLSLCREILAGAMYLRDHLLCQVELADLTDDQAERDARCTFVVVGAGYTGTADTPEHPALSGTTARADEADSQG